VSALLTLGVAVLGGVGAVCRYSLDLIIKQRVSSGLPWGTVAVNVSGSLLLGLITGWMVYGGGDADAGALLGAGFCGGYTTFSTAMFDSAALVRAGRGTAALAVLLGTLAVTVAAAAAGLALVAAVA